MCARNSRSANPRGTYAAASRRRRQHRWRWRRRRQRLRHCETRAANEYRSSADGQGHFFSLLSLYGSASECCNIESTVITHRLIDIFLFNANSTLLKVRRHESGVPEWRGTKNRMTLFTQFFIGLIFECRKVRLTHHRLSTKMKSMARAQNQLHLLISEKKMATF